MAEVLLAGRWILAIVLLSAGAAKLLSDRRQLVAAITDYGVLPDLLTELFAVVLPCLEVALGSLLAVGVLLVPVAGVAALLLGGFAAAIGWHLSRGHRFACGCGDGGEINWPLFARDLSLCAFAVAVAVGPSSDLAVWPGWAAGQASGSWQSLIPVPLAVILLMATMRLLLAAVPRLWRRALVTTVQRPAA